MCSTQWEAPVIPGTSLREPTRYQIQWLMIGAVWISFNKTNKPFSSSILVYSDGIAPLVVWI
jgi:hypothetical protein